jgi:diguanylate cyclase (GGDEF)-like protein
MLVLGWSVFLRIRLKQQTRLLRYQATHDGLTGVWNRKAVLDLLHREFEQAARDNRRIGIMMLDADHFKRINDIHGHLAGDAVLQQFAHRIQDSLRSYDLIGRYGGEEFLAILPNCEGGELSNCAERVRAAIGGDPILAEGTPLAVTVSIGTAVLDPLHNSEKEALAAADSALYEAKYAGRNRVVSSELEREQDLTHAS